MSEKTKKRYLWEPCPSYDVERMESWLQDMAREGWVLEGEDAYWFGFFTFVKTEPQELRYRLEPKTTRHSDWVNAPDSDAVELYREYGWEFVTQFHYFYIFRTADPNARELNTDLAVQATALKQIKRNTISTLFSQIIIAVYWIPRWINEAFRILVSFDWTIFPAFMAMLVTAVIVAIRDFLHIRKLRKQLNNNIPLDHNKPWQKHARINRLGKLAITLLYTYVIAALFVSCTNNMNRSFDPTPVEEFPGDPPFVTCADMGEFTQENFIHDVNTYKHYSTTFAPTIIEWEEYGTILTEDGRTIRGSLTGLAGVTTTFRVEQGKVTLTRTGGLKSEMVFRMGVPHESLYQMPFGALMLTVQAKFMYFDIVSDGGTIDLVYSIDIENTAAGEIDYHLDIRAK